jgi:hypothetical protein
MGPMARRVISMPIHLRPSSCAVLCGATVAERVEDNRFGGKRQDFFTPSEERAAGNGFYD